MSLTFVIPGAATIELTDLVFDLNGTLTNRGALIEGVEPRLKRLSSDCTIHIVSADTFGTLDELAGSLGVQARCVRNGDEKLDFVNNLGPRNCAVIGNGLNDCQALQVAALGVVILGPEGASGQSVHVADLLCANALDALDLLLEPQTLTATLRP
ncbi:MAG TPA: hypothetical protein VKV21_02945 [Solirubrobacteraceae bacterium]|nr:hypothetical protein [Solirubrobacteraceae bacterium]